MFAAETAISVADTDALGRVAGGVGWVDVVGEGVGEGVGYGVVGCAATGGISMGWGTAVAKGELGDLMALVFDAVMINIMIYKAKSRATFPCTYTRGSTQILFFLQEADITK